VQRHKLQGVHLADPDPLPPARLTIQRRVLSRGGIQVARQRIQVGMAHAGKTITIELGDTTLRVIELHGTMFGVVCTGCGARTPMTDALERVRAGEADPPCENCGGILKSATVMFGQPLQPGVYERAADAAAFCDLSWLSAARSTLIVEPAGSLCGIAAEAGASLVVINRDPTPYDHAATAVIRDPIGQAVPRLVDQLITASLA
jgi:NAD-dependent deacetylase